MGIHSRYLFPAAAAFCLLATSALRSVCVRIAHGGLFGGIALVVFVLSLRPCFGGAPLYQAGLTGELWSLGEHRPALDAIPPLNRLLTWSFLRGRHPEEFAAIERRVRGAIPPEQATLVRRYVGEGGAYEDPVAARYLVKVLDGMLPRGRKASLDPSASSRKEAALVRRLGEALLHLERARKAYARGLRLVKEGRPRRALGELDRATALDGGYAEAFLEKARVRLATGALGSAWNAYRRAVACDAAAADRYCASHSEVCQALLSPETSRWLREADERHRMGMELARQGRTDEALAMFDRSLEINPEHGEALMSRAALLSMAGDLDQALTSLDRLTRLDLPAAFRADVLSSRGFLLVRMGRRREAVADLEWALRAAPPEWSRREACERELGRLRTP